MTTIRSVNTSITSHPFVGDENFKNILSWQLSKVQCSVANYSHHATYCIPGTYQTGIVPFDHLHPFPLPFPPFTWQLPMCLLFLVCLFFTFLHVSEITHCLSFSLLVVSALLWRVLAGCPTNFWNSVLPSHYLSWRIYRAGPATPSPQPHRVSSTEATFQGSKREGRLSFATPGWAVEVFWAHPSCESWGSETRDSGLDLLKARGSYCQNQECTVWIIIQQILSFPYSSCYTQGLKKKVPSFLEAHGPFDRIKCRAVREPSLGRWRVQLDSPSAQARRAGSQGQKEWATGMVPSPQML